MSDKPTYSKDDFIKFVLATIQNESENANSSREFLKSEGLNPDSIVSEGLKRIKRLQLKIEAEKTKDEMAIAGMLKQKASEWVEKLLSKPDFSFPELIREESLTFSFRNVESLSKEDIKNILIKHYTLKFLEEQKSDQK